MARKKEEKAEDISLDDQVDGASDSDEKEATPSRQPSEVNKDMVKETEEIMNKLIEMFEIDATVSVDQDSYVDGEDVEQEFVSVKIDGEDLGVLIGYLGRNLRSLQKVVGQLLNRKMAEKSDDPKYARVVIDVSGYRENREDSLKQMAERIREEVLASGEPVDLPSMNAYERRVIHTTLAEYEDVTTESFGEGRSRYVKVFAVG